MVPVITLDWLQVHVRSVKDNYPAEIGIYKIVRQVFRTKQFKNVDYIYKNGEGVATLVGLPHSGILKPDSGLLKIENKFLYQSNVKDMLTEIISVLGLSFINVTRLDIASDFISFKNNLLPESFIHSFLIGKYLKLRKSKFSVYGMHERKTQFQYIRFGSSSSPICYYLYNKSVELRERKKKPHIEQLWKENNFDLTNDVWRLEFRLQSGQSGLISTETGEVLPVKMIEVLDNYHEVYAALFWKYFDFRYEDGQAKKDRMKKIPLLDISRPERNYMRLFDKIESNRMDKIFIGKMVGLNNELRGTDFSLNVESQKLLSQFVNSRDLKEWFEKKFPAEYERMMFTFTHNANSNL